MCVGQERKKHTVNRAAKIVAKRQNLMMPEQERWSFFTRYPPRNVPPPPAGTVMMPGKWKQKGIERVRLDEDNYWILGFDEEVPKSPTASSISNNQLDHSLRIIQFC